MAQIRDIVYRLRKGQSERTVSRQTGHHRATVARYALLAREHGLLAPACALPSEECLLALLGAPLAPPGTRSSVEPYAALVAEWLSQQVEARAIHRLLVEHHGYHGSYGSVLRYVHRQRPVQREAFVRIETAPGEEAQVDFGTVGKLLDAASGGYRTAYCFVMTLSFSRHQYVEFVFDQKMATFVGCHKRAFESMGGVVGTVVVDNLKAAVLKHDIEDPTLCAPYRRLAQHYGFLIHPCRPRTPRHKGKVESGVSYVKGNLWPEVREQSLVAANEAARKWVSGWAGMRTHGTTHKQPLEQFTAMERQALQPLPDQPFTFERLVTAKVALDCHVRVENNFYSVPYALVGKTLEAHLCQGTVQIYDGVGLVVTHSRSLGRGERISREEHYPEDKRFYLRRTPDHCLGVAEQTGKHCLELARTLAAERPKDSRRALCALIGLLDRYPAERVEAACLRAMECGDPRYTRVKALLSTGAESEPLASAACSAAPPAYRFQRSANEFFDLGHMSLEGMRPC